MQHKYRTNTFASGVVVGIGICVAMLGIFSTAIGKTVYQYYKDNETPDYSNEYKGVNKHRVNEILEKKSQHSSLTKLAKTIATDGIITSDEHDKFINVYNSLVIMGEIEQYADYDDVQKIGKAISDEQKYRGTTTIADFVTTQTTKHNRLTKSDVNKILDYVNVCVFANICLQTIN